MADQSVVENVVNRKGDGESEPLAGDEEQASASEIMTQLEFIGTKITEVSYSPTRT